MGGEGERSTSLQARPLRDTLSPFKKLKIHKLGSKILPSPAAKTKTALSPMSLIGSSSSLSRKLKIWYQDCTGSLSCLMV